MPPRTEKRPADANGEPTDCPTVRENAKESEGADGADGADAKIPLNSDSWRKRI